MADNARLTRITGLPRPAKFKSIEDAQKAQEELYRALSEWRVDIPRPNQLMTGLFERPEWYGAVGDGTTDDTAAIQEALDKIKSDGGGVLQLSPDKTYLCGQVAIPSNTEFRGAGWSSVILGLTTEPDMILQGNNGTIAAPAVCSNVHIKNLKLDAQSTARINAALGGYVRGISFYHPGGTGVGSTNVSVENCWVEDGGERAIEFKWNCSDVKVIGCRVTNSSCVTSYEGDAIHSDHSTNVLYANNVVDTFGDTALAATYSTNVTMIGNQVFGAEASGGTPTAEEGGVDINGCVNASVTGNLFYKVAYGFVGAGSYNYLNVDYVSQNILIADNVFVGSSAPLDAGIKVFGMASGAGHADDGPHYLDGLTITGNIIQNSGGPAIELSTYTKNFVVSNNVIMSPQKGSTYGGGGGAASAIMVGVSVGNPIAQGVVSNNYIYGDSDMGTGVYLNTGCTNVLCHTNHVVGAVVMTVLNAAADTPNAEFLSIKSGAGVTANDLYISKDADYALGKISVASQETNPDIIYPYLRLEKMAGTQSAPADVRVGDYIGAIAFATYKNSALSNVGGFGAIVNELGASYAEPYFFFNIVTSAGADTNVLNLYHDKIHAAQSIGIDTTTVDYPLTLKAALGAKINLYAGQNWGIGLQNNLVQFINNSTDGDWQFGSGTTSSFTPVVTIDGGDGSVNSTGSYKVDGTQVVSNRVVDADFANTPNSGDADTDDLIDKIRDALITHGLIASS